VSRLILIFILSFTCITINAQIKKLDIELYINPVNIFFLDKNKHYNNTSTDEFYVRYSNKVSQELGVNLLLSRPNKKWNWASGLSFREYNYNHTIVLQKPDEIIPISFWRDRILEVYLLGLDFGVYKTILPHTELYFNIELNQPIKVNSNLENDNNYSLWRGQNYQIRLREFKREHIMSIMAFSTPEIYFKTKLKENFLINYGAKLKWWSINEIYGSNMRGFLPNDLNEDIVYMNSTIKSTQLYFFFGLNYRFRR